MISKQLANSVSLDGMFVCIMILIFGGFTAFSMCLIPRHSFRNTKLIRSLTVGTFDTSSFITTYFPIPFFAILFFGYKFYMKSKFIDYMDMDFKTGSSANMAVEPPKQGFFAKLADNI
jgi:amino acid transporter